MALGSMANPDIDEYYEDGALSFWTGFIGFAALMLVVIGCFHAVAGLVAIFKDGYYAVPDKNLMVSVDYTAWGWVHLILGVVAVFTAVGMFAGSTWARVVAVMFAVVSALVNLAFLDAKPILATMIIAFDIVLIWAVTVHGREMKNYT